MMMKIPDILGPPRRGTATAQHGNLPSPPNDQHRCRLPKLHLSNCCVNLENCTKWFGSGVSSSALPPWYVDDECSQRGTGLLGTLGRSFAIHIESATYCRHCQVRIASLIAHTTSGMVRGPPPRGVHLDNAARVRQHDSVIVSSTCSGERCNARIISIR